MTTTKPRQMRLNQKAQLAPKAQFQEWYDKAASTSGLTELDRAILAAICGWYRRLAERGFAGSLSYERLAEAAGRPDVQCIKAVVRRLIELGLIGVKPGSGRWANEYLPALPKRIAASALTTVGEDAAPPF